MSTALSDEQLERARRHLRRAIGLSEEGMAQGCGGPFGAIVVRGDVVVGEGFNRVLCDHDPTAHAEIVAIRSACRHLGTFDLSGCDVFASAEPCPMCLAAIYWARADRVFYANTIQDAARIGFDDSYFYAELQKPADQRTVRQINIRVPEAIRAFEAWAAKPDKTGY